MELEEWWRSDSAKDCWTRGFENAATPGDDLFACKFLKCSRQHRKNLWTEYHEPYEGIRLIAFELDPTVAPPRVECRVWLYGGQDDLWAKFSRCGALTLLGSHSVRWVGVPPGRTWKRQLQESNTVVKGIQHDAIHPIFSTIPTPDEQLVVESQLEEAIELLAEQFLAWVDKVYRGDVANDTNHPGTNEVTELVEDTSSAPAPSGNEEGEWQQVTVTQYERSRANRKACLDHYGPSCQACGMSFGDVYGELGTDFIHVHHEVPLHTLGGATTVDPIADMKPLCPNCHAMAHRTSPPMPVTQLRQLIGRMS